MAHLTWAKRYGRHNPQGNLEQGRGYGWSDGRSIGPIIGSLIESHYRFSNFGQWTKETGYNIVYVKQFLDIKQYIVGLNLRYITELCIIARPRFLLMIGDDGVDGNADIVKNQLVNLA